MITKEQLNKVLNEREELKKKTEITYYQLLGQVDILKELLKLEESEQKV